MKPVRFLLITLVCLFVNVSAQAQAPRWQWADAQPFTVRSVATDAQGNAYVLGNFQGSITVGQTQLTSASAGGTDLIVAKFSPQGRAEWATAMSSRGRGAAGATGSVAGIDISVNPRTGEAHVLAQYTGRINGDFPGGGNFEVYTSAENMLFVKLSAAGQVQWAVHADGTFIPDTPRAIATDVQGNSYITCETRNVRLSNGGILTISGRRGLGIISLDSKGNFSWGNAPFTNGGYETHDVGVDEQNGLYVLGTFSGRMSFGNFSVSGFPIMVFMKINQTTGQPEWMNGYQRGGTSLAVDAKGNSYVTGSFEGTYSLGSARLTAAAGKQGLLARFAPNGSVTGLHSLGAVQPFSKVNVAGLATGNAMQNLVVALTKPSGTTSVLGLQTDGHLEWEEQANGANTPVLAVAPGSGPHARAVLAGTFTDRASFGKKTVSASGPASFLASLTFRPDNNNRVASNKAELALYPNPVRDQFTLRLPAQAGAQLQLVNLHGRVVHEQAVAASGAEAELKVNVQRLPRGLYTLRLRSAAGQTETRQVQLD